MSTIAYSGRLVVETCWCGIVHAIPENLQRQAEEHGRQVYCPLGHTWVITETVEKKLKREQERHAATKQLLRAEERSHSATRGQLTKARKRAAAGVCPCCHRTFQNVQRHVKTKHPEFAEQPS